MRRPSKACLLQEQEQAGFIQETLDLPGHSGWNQTRAKRDPATRAKRDPARLRRVRVRGESMKRALHGRTDQRGCGGRQESPPGGSGTSGNAGTAMRELRDQSWRTGLHVVDYGAAQHDRRERVLRHVVFLYHSLCAR